MSAAAFVRETLLAVLPAGVPPSFSAIVSATYSGSGRNKRARAHLTMFDGKPAVVECWQAGACRAHTFVELPGGSVSWEEDQWVRCDEHGDLLSPLPLFDIQPSALSSNAPAETWRPQ